VASGEPTLPQDLIARIKEEERKAGEALDAATRHTAERDFFIRLAHALGATGRELAELTGVSPQRIHQIARQGERTPPERPPSLATIEQEVLDLLAVGRTTREIASSLAMSTEGVRATVHAILEKMQVSSRLEAVAKHVRQAGERAVRESNR
jgi:DNA-binding NarL/FixJ family response regulator